MDNTADLMKTRGSRVKELLKENGMKQRELAEKLDYTNEHLNRILNGREPLTEKTASEIVKIFPSVRIEWILGLDDFRSESEKGWTQFFEQKSEWDKRLTAFRLLLDLAGYEIQLRNEDNQDTLSSIINGISEGYIIKKDGVILGRCPIERYNLMAFDIQELAEQRIKSYLREAKGIGEYHTD